MKRRMTTSILMIFSLAGSIVILLSGYSKEPEQLSTLNGNKVLKDAAVNVSQDRHQYIPNEMLVKFKVDSGFVPWMTEGHI